MLSPTLHRIDVGGVMLFSCCALLAHLTPLLLGRAVRLESVDPQNRGIIRCDLDPSGLVSYIPTDAVGSFVETDEGMLAIDVSTNFCSHVHHFTDRRSAEVYVHADPRRYVLEISQLRAAAEELYRAAWS